MIQSKHCSNFPSLSTKVRLQCLDQCRKMQNKTPCKTIIQSIISFSSGHNASCVSLRSEALCSVIRRE
ncbi:hypothetical protein FJTKL_04231 [Diaporthe vaccinii]|uniref:Uncharacterized protein n=1 Tax=Diaporthe vaccinii TaxID=105482 RepID=A0ABR4F094_9PEZI